MIWISQVSAKFTFSMKKPAKSKDFKVFDDLGIYCQYAIDIFNEKNRNVERFQVFGDLVIYSQYAIGIFNEKTRNVERFQGL